MSGPFIGYMVGYTIAIIGVGYALNAAGVAREWIIAVVLILIGLGIVYAISRSQRDRTYDDTHKPSSRTDSSAEVPRYGNGPKPHS